MIKFSGSVLGRLRHPYIYAIIKEHCIYIGETQLHPVSRWGQHLKSDGSFMKRLREADEEVWSSKEDILFLCVSCEIIATVAPEEQKLVTQYVEHKVHERCILDKPRLLPVEVIISDTVNTAPSRCRYSWANDLASQVFDEISHQLLKSRHI
jgi:hypothetical protein